MSAVIFHVMRVFPSLSVYCDGVYLPSTQTDAPFSSSSTVFSAVCEKQMMSQNVTCSVVVSVSLSFL